MQEPPCLRGVVDCVVLGHWRGSEDLEAFTVESTRMTDMMTDMRCIYVVHAVCIHSMSSGADADPVVDSQGCWN